MGWGTDIIQTFLGVVLEGKSKRPMWSYGLEDMLNQLLTIDKVINIYLNNVYRCFTKY